jgi:hypothetical protein
MNVLQQGGGMAESLIDKRALAQAAEKGEAGDSCRQQDVLLGVSGGEKPLTFLLVLDGACIDAGKPSLLREVGRRLLKRFASPPPKADGPVAPGDDPPGELYRQWRQVHDPAVRKGEQTTLRAADRMPDVKGRSLRQALQELQGYGIPLEVSGSGRVTGQEPKAGSPLTGVGRITLELQAK